MTAPHLRPIGDVESVPSFRVLAWKGWRNGPLDHGAAHRLHTAAGVAGSVDCDTLIESIHDFARRHRVLGAAYYDVDGRPWLDMNAARTPRIEQFDASGANPGELELRVQKIITEFTRGGFDLRGPLFRVALIRTGPSQFRVLASTHHLISDNVSLSLVSNHLQKWLSHDVDPRSDGPDAPLDYGDYLFCMNEWFESDASNESRIYWKSLLSNAADEFLRPMAGIAGNQPGAYADRVEFAIGGPVLQKIDELARALGTTRFTVLLAAQHALMASANDSESALVVAVTDGREHKSLRGTLGYMADKVIFRSTENRSNTFGALVKSLHRQTAQSYPHRYFRYDRLLHEFWPEMASRITPPMFNFRRQVGAGSHGAQFASHPGLVLARKPPSGLETHPARTNFSLEVIDRGAILTGKLAFSRQGCEMVMQMFGEILQRVSPDGRERISALTTAH